MVDKDIQPHKKCKMRYFESIRLSTVKKFDNSTAGVSVDKQAFTNRYTGYTNRSNLFGK